MAKQFISNNLEKINDNIYSISGEEFKHILVLRHKIDDVIVINNSEYKIINITKENIKLEKIKDLKVYHKEYKLTLYQGILKSDKIEYVIQKSVELGVDKINIFFSKNSVVKLDEKDKTKKLLRYNKIATEAVKQCGRNNDIKDISFLNFKEMDYKGHDIVLFAYENETKKLKEVLKDNKFKDIAIIIGPEGGFDKTEIKEIEKYSNVKTISLGKNILRAETASLNLLSIVNYEMN